MSQPRVPDELWEAIEPLLPREPPKPKGGRPRIPDRAALGGIIFVLRTGTPWRLLPRKLGCGSGPTCWRRLRDWQAAGVREARHRQVLNWLSVERVIDWSRASIDSLSVRAKRGTSRPARTRSTAASSGASTTCSWTAKASRWRSSSRGPTPTTRPTWSAPSTRSRPSSARPPGPDDPASGPTSCTAIKATTTRRSGRALRRRGIAPRIARKGIESSEKLGRRRWVAARSLAWLLGFRRLGVRYERRAGILRACCSSPAPSSASAS